MKTKQDYIKRTIEEVKSLQIEETDKKTFEVQLRRRLPLTVFEDVIRQQKDEFVKDILVEFLMRSQYRVKYKGDL